MTYSYYYTPKPGMLRMFETCTHIWGNPLQWHPAIRDLVCDRVTVEQW